MLIALATAALACFTTLNPAAPPASDFVDELRSPDAGRWRYASIQLAHLGKDALPTLESLAEKEDKDLAPRLIETVEIMLVRSVEPKELESTPHLKKLCQPEFEKGLEAARKLAAFQSYVREYGLGPPGARARDPDGPVELTAQLAAMRGAGIPGVVRLLDSPSANTKLYGVAAALNMGAVSLRARLETLARSREDVTVGGDCSYELTTLGKYVTRELDTRGAFSREEPYRKALDCEGSITASGLTAADKGVVSERLRHIPSAWASQSWDDYWLHARATFTLVVSQLERSRAAPAQPKGAPPR